MSDTILEQINGLDLLYKIQIGAIGTIPVVGGLLSQVASQVVPHKDETAALWEKLMPLVEILIDEKQNEFETRLLNDLREGLGNLIVDWNSTTKDRKKEKFIALDGWFLAHEPRYAPEDTKIPRIKLPFLVLIGTLYLGYLNDLAFHYSASTGEIGKDAAYDLSRLYNKADDYIRLLNGMRIDCAEWRMDLVSVDPGYTAPGGEEPVYGIRIEDKYYPDKPFSEDGKQRYGLRLGITQDQDLRAAQFLLEWRGRVRKELDDQFDQICKPADAWKGYLRAVLQELMYCQEPAGSLTSERMEDILKTFDADGDATELEILEANLVGSIECAQDSDVVLIRMQDDSEWKAKPSNK